MKPCSKNRKLIAWLALDSLPTGQATELRAHIQRCPECRGYLEEITSVAETLAAAKEIPRDIQTSSSFHQRVVRALAAGPAPSPWHILITTWLRGAWLNWRLALPIVIFLAIAGAGLFGWGRHSVRMLPTRSGLHDGSIPARVGDTPPTMANYERAAEQSLEALDKLLAAQARRNPAPAPVYTASGRSEMAD
jgi:anti-sigma factor RsiW